MSSRNLLIVAGLLMFLSGCGKKAETHGAQANPATPNSLPEQNAQAATGQTPTPSPAVPGGPSGRGEGAPVALPPPPPAALAPPENGNYAATLSQLSDQLRMYVVRTRTAPKTFAEFVANSGVQPPQPPPGMHYAIQGGAVVLQK